MKKHLNFLAIFLTILAMTFIGNAQQEKGKSPTPTPTPLPSLELKLDKTVAIKECPFYQTKFCPKENEQINIQSIIKNVSSENDLTYIYKVSGGEIIGKGENVIWDFAKARPGIYTISAEIDDGKCLRVKSEIKTIKLGSCECHPSCTCPSISVSPSDKIFKAGETITFTANLSGGIQDTVTYHWKIYSGFEVEVETNSPTISIKTTPEMSGSYITATVEVRGLCAECQQTASATVQVLK